MKIQPITTWFNGEPQTATNFTLISIRDNFTDAATLYYELQKEVVNEDLKVIGYENLITATLDITAQDYQDWTSTPDANAWIFNWTANKLKLVLIAE